MNINLNEFMPLREACKLYGKDASTLLRRIKDKDNGNCFTTGQTAYKIGGIWFLSIEQLNKIYRK